MERNKVVFPFRPIAVFPNFVVKILVKERILKVKQE